MPLNSFKTLSSAYSFPVQSRSLPIGLDTIGIYHSIGSYVGALPDTGVHGSIGLVGTTNRYVAIDGMTDRSIGLICTTSRSISIDGAIK